MKKQKGITLITLVVTIIVLLILAGVTLSLVAGENGILKRATNAVEVNEKAIAEEQANLLLANLAMEYYEERYVNNKEGLTTVDAYLAEQLESETATDTGEYSVTIKEGKVIVSKGGKEISRGTLSDGKVVGWTGSSNSEDTPIEVKSQNRTLGGKTTGYTYKNPVIPQGFNTVDEGAEWRYIDRNETEVVGWNDGLVIEDEIGNQFVWVPVDGINVRYEKNFSYPSNYGANESNTSDNTSVCPVGNENTQITNYGGFYVARYEAGNENASSNSTTPNNIEIVQPLSIAGTKVWNNISYNNAAVAAELMVKDTNIYGNNKSGLITGTQWDTIMKWYSNSGVAVDSTQKWGTYHNLDYAGNGKYFKYDSSVIDNWEEGEFTHKANTGPFLYHAVGENSNGIQKNIADLGGNVWEWTSETNASNGVIRGGFAVSIADNTATFRFIRGVTFTEYDIGFRAVLYIQ